MAETIATTIDLLRHGECEGGAIFRGHLDVALAEAGLAQAVVTNNVREFADMGDGRGWRRMVPMEHMTVVVDSSVVGMRKPDAEIFAHLLGELGVHADEAVLVDDTPVNLDGARLVGMQTVLVGSDPAPAMTELRSLVLGDPIG